MNTVLSLDYEIYFGAQSGSAELTLIEPTTALCRLARQQGVRLVFFVDALWLLRLREEAPRHARLMTEHYRVSRQLESIARAGHELQLHLHPHWLDTGWDGNTWRMDLRRYRLHDFADAEIAQMTRAACDTLRALDGSTPVSTFRAGGWCIQPFERLRKPLMDNGICIDSTVYRGGSQQGDTHHYDFTQAPEDSHWRFDHDPLVPQDNGHFLEVPIASHRVSPWWYWRMAAARKLRLADHRALGEGRAVGPSRGDIARKLFQRSASVVSIDGLKCGFLEAAWRNYQRLGMEDFVVIGHPKAQTPYSLRKLEDFLQGHARERFVGFDLYRRRKGAWPSLAAGSRPRSAGDTPPLLRPDSRPMPLQDDKKPAPVQNGARRLPSW